MYIVGSLLVLKLQKNSSVTITKKSMVKIYMDVSDEYQIVHIQSFV
jgi:hypothetical protein